MTRGWALVLGIFLCLLGLWSLTQDVVYGLRHGFNAPVKTDFADWSTGTWGVETLPRKYVLMPLGSVMLSHAEGLLVGLAVVAGCWLLAWWQKRAAGELPVRADAHIHIVKHDDT